MLHTCCSLIIRVLGLDVPVEKPQRPQGHSAASYRAAREKKRAEDQARETKRLKMLLPQPVLDGAVLKKEYTDWLEKDKGSPKDGLLSTTILEEEDTSENGV